MQFSGNLLSKEQMKVVKGGDSYGGIYDGNSTGGSGGTCGARCYWNSGGDSQWGLSKNDAIAAAKEMDVKEVFIIGGGEIYKMAWEKANRVYLTRIKLETEGDTFFPEINPKEWRLVNQKDFDGDEKNVYPHSFQTWERV